MNCRRFAESLAEYMDGTLPPGDRMAADRHLAGCAACCAVLHRHRQTAQALSRTFQHATASLRLRPNLQQRVLRDLAAPAAAETPRPFAPWHFARWLWPWPALAGMLVAAAWLAWQGAPAPPAPVAISPAPQPPPRVSIHVAYRVPTHTFHKEGPFVRDSLLYHTVVVKGGLGPEPTLNQETGKNRL